VCVLLLMVASAAAAARASVGHRSPLGPAGYVLAAGRSYGATAVSPAAVTAAASSSSPPTTNGPATAGHPSHPATSAASALGPLNALPTPAPGALPAVTPLGPLRSADAVVLLRNPITPAETTRVVHLSGLSAIEEVATGSVQLAGAPVVTFGVDPGTFRAFTPAASASADRLWQYLAGGSLVSSYEMATDRRLTLGAEEPISSPGPAGTLQGWLGAFASIGLPGVDLLVDQRYAPDLGLAPKSGLVISAPGASGTQLLSELKGALPGAAVELLHPDQVSNLIGGNGLNSTERSTLLSSALSRVGLPYVWGATGPSSFDCSGLVQWAMARAGVLMPRTADQQFLTGVHIPLSAAAPGDLLFWTYDPNDPGFVDHTAIYLGNGMMVVAPHTGLDVQVVPVPTADFAGAVHVLLRSG
jgi:hypothetical protein